MNAASGYLNTPKENHSIARMPKLKKISQNTSTHFNK